MSDSVQPHRWQPTRFPRPWDFPGKNTGVGCHFLLQCIKVKSESEVAQLCPTLYDPVDCSLPGSSVHGIFSARVLEWGAIAFSDFTHTNVYVSILILSDEMFSLLHIQACVTKTLPIPDLLTKNLHFNKNLRKFSREGNGTPLQYSCLENPMDGGAW